MLYVYTCIVEILQLIQSELPLVFRPVAHFVFPMYLYFLFLFLMSEKETAV